MLVMIDELDLSQCALKEMTFPGSSGLRSWLPSPRLL